MKQVRIPALLAAVAVILAGCGDPAIADAQRLVREQLADGKSARFENVTTQKTVMDDEITMRPIQPGEEAVCGWVNAKNALGAYAGAERFLVKSGFSTFKLDDDEAWSRAFLMCVIQSGDKEAKDRHTRENERLMQGYLSDLRKIEGR